LTLGYQDAQVTALQQRLTALGVYSGPVTGYYGALTEQAVIKYQAAHGLSQTGAVGPATRTALNAGQ
jgi:peptidoglycan hydrolase-like protein with peptidoglycan-binding domain